MKLVYREGSVRCASSTLHNSRWGCFSHPCQDNALLNVVVTDDNDNIIFPAKKYLKSAGLWYYLPFTDARSSDELVFTDYANPVYLASNAKVRIWYGEDLKDWKNADNAGKVCVDVYGHFIQL